MPKTTHKNRKRRSAAVNRPPGFSGALGIARDLLAQGKYEEGLTALNQLAASTRNTSKQAKILLIVGESQTKLSRHTEASAAFSRASQYASQAKDYDLLVRAGVGQVRALLRSLRTAAAGLIANQLIVDIAVAQQQIDAILNLNPVQLAAQGNVTIPARPPRATVVLTKIAAVFVESGLTEEARVYLQQAIQLSPNGASRARQALAKLALAADEPALAERYARESLLMGRFQSKTVAAWQPYLDARARQNLVPILEADVLASFKANTEGRIAGASILSIVRILRMHGDPQWKVLAASAISSPTSDVIITMELEKIQLADEKLSNAIEPSPIAARALRLFSAQNTSRQEQIAHAKAYVRYSICAGDIPNFNAISSLAVSRFGMSHGISVRHAMALGAIDGNSYAMARDILVTLKSELAESEAWGRVTWALARMEAGLAHNAEASGYYMEVANSASTPVRFRIQAMLLGFRYLTSSDNRKITTSMVQSARELIESIVDYRVGFEAARKIAVAGAEFSCLLEDLVDRSIALADDAFENASTPWHALTILDYSCRKLQCNVIGRPNEVVIRWKKLTNQQKLEFKSVGGSTWFEYLSTVFKSFVSLGRDVDALGLASDVIDHDKSSPEGYVIVGSDYALWLLNRGQMAQAFEYFGWIASEVPSHRRAAFAHYWLSLKALKAGDHFSAVNSAHSVGRCFSGSPSLRSEWELDARAELIRSDMSIDAVVARCFRYDREFLSQMKFVIEEDLNTL